MFNGQNLGNDINSQFNCEDDISTGITSCVITGITNGIPGVGASLYNGQRNYQTSDPTACSDMSGVWSNGAAGLNGVFSSDPCL